jgi:DnaJ family protein C protein 2
MADLRWAATDNEIKKAYRKMVLLYHPDKLAERGEKGGEETFRGIQKAYDILSDPEKRRDYDSQDAPKDEKYPGVEQLVAAPDFYKMAGDIFRRQARWSKVDDVPVIGDDKTPIGEVKEFYNWWMQMYESWRTWKHEDEYDLNQAENRNERRWMVRNIPQ